MMLSGTTATAVAAGIFTPEDGRVLVGRTDPQTINDSMALTIQCVASVSNMGRRLHVRNHEVRALRSQVTILQQLLKNKQKLVELKQENKGLKNLMDFMFIHLNTRFYAQLYVCMCVCLFMKGEISLSLTNMILLKKKGHYIFFRELGEKPILSPQPIASRTAFEARLWSYSILWTVLLNY